jgi:hypothetical protein
MGLHGIGPVDGAGIVDGNQGRIKGGATDQRANLRSSAEFGLLQEWASQNCDGSCRNWEAG